MHPDFPNIPRLPIGLNQLNYIDKLGYVFPWFTLPFLVELDTWDLSNVKVLELGCGYSTVWWNSRVGLVVGIDNDLRWVEALGPHIGKGMQIFYSDGPERHIELIHRAVDQHGPFDIIVNDGTYRDEVTEACMAAIKIGGRVILDNPEMAPKFCEAFRFNPCRQFPQPYHPIWRTDYWVVVCKRAWTEQDQHDYCINRAKVFPPGGLPFLLNSNGYIIGKK